MVRARTGVAWWCAVLAVVLTGAGAWRGPRTAPRTLSMVQLMPSSSRQTKTVFLYNTLTRKKEEFKSRSGGPAVSFYSCGPTVYDYAHIGNFRAFLTYDLLKRWLEYSGYEVDHVCNLTDVDDKIIVKMTAEGKTLKEVTEKYSSAFFEDLDVLNIKRAQRYPKATDHIKDIVEMIQTLVDKKFAYVENGSVYFRVDAFKDYGRLANLKFDEMIKGAGGFGPNDRRGADEKESARDFALWKAFTEQDGDVVWDSAFGRGRPGWHIECSAMCNCLLGPSIDLHGGGVDLVFPHHSNEIAQSEAFSGERFCNYWVHNGFVNIDNEKMSKSLKNFKTLRDLAQSPFDARALRFMVVTSQYRAPLNFAPDTLKAAGTSLQRIDKLVARLESATAGAAGGDAAGGAEIEAAAESALTAFETAMSDDLNTPRALAALFGLVGATEKALQTGVSPDRAARVLATIRRMDSVFGVLYTVPEGYFKSGTAAAGAGAGAGAAPIEHGALPQEVLALARSRAELKAAKKYAEADAARARISEMGYSVKDKAGGEFDVFRI